MNDITTHTDSVNGTPIEIVLNAPYETLAAGNSHARGESVTNFCHQHSSNYAKVVGEQVWASPFQGVLLSAFIEQHLPEWELDESECLLYFPLDDAIYSIEVTAFGACVPGSESIISYEQTLELPNLPLHVLSGGTLTSQFDDVIAIEGLEKLKEFNFSSLNKELLRNRYFVTKHYAGAAVTAVFAIVAITTASSALLNDETPSVLDTIQQIVTPTGNDLAVNQLHFIDDVLKNDLNYFFGKGLHKVSYDTKAGIIIEGDYPRSAVMGSLIKETRDANLTLLLTQNGWQITKIPEIQLRPKFNLDPFNDNYQAIKRIEERHGFSVAMNAPSTNLERRSVEVELSKELSGPPPLAEIAQALVGYSISVDSLVITIKDYQYEHLLLTLTVSGDKS
ncbi:MAG: hypothetical protein JKY40_10610 [Gammaproteobacteria bacterium]|nr:hypothetical protein [Gammaproteobacteria bacterium]MBL4729737.1 hypothetical protein [Gammaproteobacteria bacterium]